MAEPEAVPLVRTVKRYVCPFCHQGRSKPTAAQDHIDRCWKNPAQESCGTCAHYELPCCSAANGDCGCNGEAECAVGADMRAGTDDGETRIVRHCISWGSRG